MTAHPHYSTSETMQVDDGEEPPSMDTPAGGGVSHLKAVKEVIDETADDVYSDGEGDPGQDDACVYLSACVTCDQKLILSGVPA